MGNNCDHVLELCEEVIKNEYTPCGLEDAVKQRLLEVTRDWETLKKKADEQGRSIGGLNVLSLDLLRAAEQAKADERRFGKPKCYYLRRGLEIPRRQKGGLGYWFLIMRE